MKYLHTMVRVTDIAASVDFYVNKLGLKEVRRIEAMGVKITLNHKVEDVLAERAEGRFDAVFIAIGAQIGMRNAVVDETVAMVDARLAVNRKAAA